jgi:monoamine oxidase
LISIFNVIEGQPAVQWLDQTAQVRKVEIIESLVRFFGVESREFIDYIEYNWSDEKFSGGCPTVNIGSSGIMEDFVRATREPFINVHFAGTESATQWQGFMDGAVESGERAAQEVIHVLAK